MRIQFTAATMLFGALLLSAADSTPPGAGLKLSAEEQALRFDANAEEPYTLGEGDELSIDVAGHPDLSAKHIVGPDGKITVPTIGPVNIMGKTREEAAALISELLQANYRTVLVTVRVDKY